MALASRHLKDKLESMEMAAVMCRTQKRLEREGAIPSSPVLLLRALKTFLEISFEVILGVLVAGISILAVFYICNRLFHINLNNIF